jgi:hypothetical protein
MVMRKKIILASLISGSHAVLLTVALFLGGLSMSSLDGANPTIIESIMENVSSILIQPVAWIKSVIGITPGSGLECFLLLFNSAIWGGLTVGLIALVAPLIRACPGSKEPPVAK